VSWRLAAMNCGWLRAAPDQRRDLRFTVAKLTTCPRGSATLPWLVSAARTAAATLIIALFASPAFAQSDRAYRLALAGAVTAHGLDLSTSSHCLGAGTCRELNPILRPLSDTPLAFGAAKMGIAAASLLATDALRRRGHRKAAFWIAVGQSIAFTYIAVRNVRSASQ
jgi:hypothetical protein